MSLLPFFKIGQCFGHCPFFLWGGEGGYVLCNYSNGLLHWTVDGQFLDLGVIRTLASALFSSIRQCHKKEEKKVQHSAPLTN